MVSEGGNVGDSDARECGDVCPLSPWVSGLERLPCWLSWLLQVTKRKKKTSLDKEG